MHCENVTNKQSIDFIVAIIFKLDLQIMHNNAKTITLLNMSRK